MDLRKALALDYFLLQHSNDYYSDYYAVGNPPDPGGTFSTTTFSSISAGQDLGAIGPGVRYGAERNTLGIRIPSYLPVTTQYSPLLRSLAILAFGTNCAAVLEAWECSGFKNPAAAADWDDRVTQIGSISVPATGTLSDQAFTTLYASTYNPGTNYSFIFCTTEERTDTIPAGAPVYPGAWSARVSGSAVRHRLYI